MRAHIMRSNWCPAFGLMVLLTLALLTSLALPLNATGQPAPDETYFPTENFVQINPTLPNSKLNFDDDSRESCCAKDYTPNGQPITGTTSGSLPMPGQTGTTRNLAKSEFERANPRYLENSTPSFLVSCDRYGQMPETASNMPPVADADTRGKTLPITSYSTNVSVRTGAQYATDPAMRNTSDFHIETAGGAAVVQLRDVNSYSLCMGRGGNTAMAVNTDNGSIMTYNGSDRILLAGNNTNMLARTGAGEDLIELHLARPNQAQGAQWRDQSWTSFQIYKTAISGGSDTDTLVLKNVPYGTKWCHIGGYRIYGEYFYVVELALPPSVTEGPRRQRINIGTSVEYIVIKGKRYALREFLAHGQPVSTVALK